MKFLVTTTIFPLPEPEPLDGSNLIPDDLIEAITGIRNLTHAWNKYKLRLEVVDEAIREAVSRTPLQSELGPLQD